MDYINWNPNALDEGSVFAFQAPVDGHYPVDATETIRQPGSVTLQLFGSSMTNLWSFRRVALLRH